MVSSRPRVLHSPRLYRLVSIRLTQRERRPFSTRPPLGQSRTDRLETPQLRFVPHLSDGNPLQLSARLGSQLHFKREDLTPVFSFKLRGAYNMMKQLTDEERWRGVIACSAGKPTSDQSVTRRRSSN